MFVELLHVEGDFSSLYARDNGRPNWSVARLLGIVLLAELFNVADQDALDALSFDARWQHALGLRPEEAYLSRRSLVEFRGRIARQDAEALIG